MKKVISLALATAMLCCSLVACGSSSSSSSSTTAAPADTAAAAEAAEPAAEADSSASSGESYTFRCSTNHAEDFCTSVALQQWADMVKERTDGRINIEVYYNAVLGDEKSATEQLQYGGLEFARISISPICEFVDDFNALQMPFIYKDADHFWEVLNSLGMDMLHSDSMKEAGFYGLCWYDGGTRNFYNSKKEIHTPADMAGMNIRVQESNLMVGMIDCLGATATAMAYGDVYSALQTGVIDGAENSIVQWLEVSHYEVAPYFTYDMHTRAPDMLIMSEKTREMLSDEDLQIIQDAAIESSMNQRELWAEADAESEAELLEKGVTITYLTEDELDQFKTACEPLWADYEGGKYLDIINEIQAMAD